MKKYFYFIILFSIIFYLLLNISKSTKSNLVIIESKIFFYLIVMFLFIVINDILETPIELQDKFIYITIFSLLLIYFIGYIIEYYDKKSSLFTKTFYVFLVSLFISVIASVIIYYLFKDKRIYDKFNNGFAKNYKFLIFIFVYVLVYNFTFYMTGEGNSNLNNIICPASLGLLLILFIFIFIIKACLKLKIINKIQILNAFIALSAIATFLLFALLQIFMSSLNTVCTTNEDVSTVEQSEFYSLLLLICIFAILWLDDSRNWHRSGSIVFVIVTLFGLYCMFYYSMTHPSISLLSLWFFIEWLIIIFNRKQNSKNSIHYAFMNV
jgi:hypothetical protein